MLCEKRLDSLLHLNRMTLLLGIIGNDWRTRPTGTAGTFFNGSGVCNEAKGIFFWNVD